MAKIVFNVEFDPSQESLTNILRDFLADNGEIPGQITLFTPQAAQDETVQTEASITPETNEAPTEVQNEPQAAPVTPAETTEKVSKGEIMQFAAKLAKAGKKEELRKVFAEFNATKLSEVKESDYFALKRKLGELDA